MFARIGILGILGIIIFLAWFIGWVFLGFHDGLYHLLFPIAVVLMVAQGVRRVARSGRLVVSGWFQGVRVVESRGSSGLQR